MRRRDVAFLCLAWAGLLAGLVWALSTQFRWFQEAGKTSPPPVKPEAAEPLPSGSTGVIGTIDDDTRAAMARANAPKALEPPPQSARRGQGPTASRSRPSGSGSR